MNIDNSPLDYGVRSIHSDQETFAQENPLIHPGWVAIETDTGRFKIGIGSDYLATPYVSTSADTCAEHGHHHGPRWAKWIGGAVALDVIFHIFLHLVIEGAFHGLF